MIRSRADRMALRDLVAEPAEEHQGQEAGLVADPHAQGLGLAARLLDGSSTVTSKVITWPSAAAESVAGVRRTSECGDQERHVAHDRAGQLAPAAAPRADPRLSARSTGAKSGNRISGRIIAA